MVAKVMQRGNRMHSIRQWQRYERNNALELGYLRAPRFRMGPNSLTFLEQPTCCVWKKLLLEHLESLNWQA